MDRTPHRNPQKSRRSRKAWCVLKETSQQSQNIIIYRRKQRGVSHNCEASTTTRRRGVSICWFHQLRLTVRQLCPFPTNIHARSPNRSALRWTARDGEKSELCASVQENWHARRAYCHSAKGAAKLYRLVAKGSRKNEWKCISSARCLFIRGVPGEFQLRTFSRCVWARRVVSARSSNFITLYCSAMILVGFWRVYM